MTDQIYINGQQPLLLTEARYVLGRIEGCEILFPADDSSVSRRHAILQCDQQRTWDIIDLASTNGTFVNGTQIADRHQLRDGDNIGIGNHHIILYAPRALPVEVPAEPLVVPVAPPIVELPVEQPQNLAPPSTPPAAPPTAQFPFNPPVFTEPVQPTALSEPAPATATFPGIPIVPETQPAPQVENPTVEIKSSTPLGFPQPEELRNLDVTVEIPPSTSPQPVSNPNNGQPPTVQVHQEGTPFDHPQDATAQIPQPGIPPVQPKQPMSQINDLWDSVRKVFTPDNYRAGSVSFVPEDQLLILRIMSWVAAPLMLISLALPWVNIYGSYSYISILMEVASAGPKSMLQGVNQDPSSALFILPLLMTILLIGAAGYAFLAHQAKTASTRHLTPQIVLSLIAGVPGVLGVAWLYYQLNTASQQISFLPVDLHRFVGAGIPAIGLASLLAVAAGIFGIVLMSQHQ